MCVVCVIVPFDDDNGIAAFNGRPNSKGASLPPSLRINRGQKMAPLELDYGYYRAGREKGEEKLSLTLTRTRFIRAVSFPTFNQLQA